MILLLSEVVESYLKVRRLSETERTNSGYGADTGVPKSHNIVPAWHPHAKILRIDLSLRFKPLGIYRRRTTVIGICGALGNTKATSSNLPRRRKFSAIESL